MGRRTRRYRLIGGVTASLLTLGISAALLTSASASPDHKAFTTSLSASPAAPADGDPAIEVWSGDSPALTLTLTNRSSTQSIGSADIALPSVIANARAATLAPSQGTAAIDGGVIQLRSLGLAAGSSVAVTFDADVVCTAPESATYAFTTAVKQANNFSGAGNDFVQSGDSPALDLVGACSLAFGAQPADAEVNTAITNQIFTPTGYPVTVRVVDGSGSGLVEWWSTGVSLAIGANPGGGTLSSANGAVPTATPSAGIAAFSMGNAPRIDTIGSGYTLTASSGALPASSPSGTFNIVTYGRPCNGNNERCTTGTLSGAKSTAEVSAFANQGELLRASLFDPAAPTAPQFACAGYTTTTDVLDFDLITPTGGATTAGKTVVFTLRGAFVTRAANRYDVCWQAPVSFTTKSGATATGNPDDWYVGLLPTCSNRVGAPCVQSRSRDSRTGNVTITILAPGGDPRAKF